MVRNLEARYLSILNLYKIGSDLSNYTVKDDKAKAICATKSIMRYSILSTMLTF